MAGHLLCIQLTQSEPRLPVKEGEKMRPEPSKQHRCVCHPSSPCRRLACSLEPCHPPESSNFMMKMIKVLFAISFPLEKMATVYMF